MNHNSSNHSGKDPVCGATISKSTAKVAYRYKGRILYFCSARCLSKFSKKPQHYLDLARNHHRKLPPRMKPRINGMKGFHPYSASVASQLR